MLAAKKQQKIFLSKPKHIRLLYTQTFSEEKNTVGREKPMQANEGTRALERKQSILLVWWVQS